MWSERAREGGREKGAGIFRRPRCCDGGEADFFFFLCFLSQFFLGRDEKIPTETRWSSKKGGGPLVLEKESEWSLLICSACTRHPSSSHPLFHRNVLEGNYGKSERTWSPLWSFIIIFGFFLMWLSSFLQGNSSFLIIQKIFLNFIFDINIWK